jgi:hypothetical protein
MHLTVLAVPDCPNVNLLEQRLTLVLEHRRDGSIWRPLYLAASGDCPAVA